MRRLRPRVIGFRLINNHNRVSGFSRKALGFDQLPGVPSHGFAARRRQSASGFNQRPHDKNPFLNIAHRTGRGREEAPSHTILEGKAIERDRSSMRHKVVSFHRSRSFELYPESENHSRLYTASTMCCSECDSPNTCRHFRR